MSELISPNDIFKMAQTSAHNAAGSVLSSTKDSLSIERVAEVPTIGAPVPRQEKPFNFNLRGDSLNKMIDASAPLLALVLRVSGLSDYKDVDELHKRALMEIESIELELHKLAYDRVSILSHRYCLCSVLDEAIMATSWGENSNWSARSLLATFHNETWGGEKFFVILDRLMMEPNRYLELLEFLYLCLSLGYEGRYKAMHNGRLQHEAVLKEVHDAIRKAKGPPDTFSLLKADHIVTRLHHITWQTPLTLVAGIGLVSALLLYFGYFFYTESQAADAIAELHKVIGK